MRIFFTFSAILLVLHGLATTFYWYWTLSWPDALVHFAGGGVVAAFLVMVFRGWGFRERLFVVLGGTLFVGVLWEFIEPTLVLYGVLAGPFVVTPLDTGIDIVADVFGGVTVWILTRRSV